MKATKPLSGSPVASSSAFGDGGTLCLGGAVRLKWRRSVVAVPMPEAAAMVSTVSSVVSSDSWAWRIRCVSSHRSGVVPVAGLKRRPRWRELIRAWRARSCTVSGSPRRPR